MPVYRKDKKFKIFRGREILSAALVLTFALPCQSHAKEHPKTLDPAALRLLAKDFVTKVGGKLKTYEQENPSGMDDPLTLIPDGELLLLRPRSDKFIMDAEIGAIKNANTIYLSLQEIISRLELAIDYDAERETGSGWFLREDWLIRFDLKKGEVVSRGETYAVTPADIYRDGADIYISQAALKKWMEIETSPDLAQQYLNINVPYPYPALARNYRERKVDGRRGRNVSVLPRLDEEEKMFDINTVETQQTLRMRRGTDRPTTTVHQNVTSAEGEVLKHNAYGVAFWDSEENLTSIRGRLSKESENPDLLGPLKARSYTIGDTDLPNLPLTGNVSQELGVRVNNNPLRNADFQMTTISGDTLPGWDVELYRDGFLVDRIRVEEDARYEFADIELYAGDNEFEVFFYGPQGEIRRDSFNIPVNEEFLATQDDTYDFSLSFQDSQTYNKILNEDEDANTPQLVARYNKLIGNTLTYAGIRAKQQDGEQKAYVATGFTNVLGGFVLDGNVAMDEKASKALQLSTRKNIDDWRLSLTGDLRDEDFDSDAENRGVLSILANANKNFITPFDTRINFNTTGQYQEFANDSKQTTASAGVSHQWGRFTLSDTLRYRKFELAESISNSDGEDYNLDNIAAARLSFGKFFTSAGITYNIKPEAKIDDYFAQLSYYPTNRLSTDLTVQHDPDDRFTRGRLNVNYRHDKFRLTPYVGVDSDSDVETGVRLSTSFIDRPGTAMPLMTGDRVIGRGLVSSFVFYDKNGNNLFDEGEEPLPDVEVESVNVSRRAATDEKGYSLIKDLPESIVTDIQIDRSTLPDPFMIPGFKGVSVFPRAGQMTNLVFPVHMAGEIDGTAYVQNKGLSNIVGDLPVNLYPIDGKSTEVVTAYTAGDGYYIFNTVPPGKYILTANAERANKLRAGGAAPVLVDIGYEGTTIYGQNIELKKGRVQVPVDLKTYSAPDTAAPLYALQTGSRAKSRLALVLEKIMERGADDLQSDLALFPLENSDDLKYLPGQGLMEHYSRCQALNDSHIPCKVLVYIPQKSDDKIRTAQK